MENIKVSKAATCVPFLLAVFLIALLPGCGSGGTANTAAGIGATPPAGLVANATFFSEKSLAIDLSWDASAGAAGYTIYNGTDNSILQAVFTNSASITGLAPSTKYCYSVYAYDAAGHYSAQSRQACATTGELLPDTGETTCYDSSGNVISCAGTGEDGADPINPLRYTDNGDGTITDGNTGLVWQKCGMGQTGSDCSGGAAAAYNWYQAAGVSNATYNPPAAFANACGSLNLGGHTDWRLPTSNELIDIVDYGQYNPAIDATYFPNTEPGFYWSSDTEAGSPSSAWYVNFQDGDDNAVAATGGYYVRCVRN